MRRLLRILDDFSSANESLGTPDCFEPNRGSAIYHDKMYEIFQGLLESMNTSLIENEEIPLNTEFLSEEEVSLFLGISRPTVNRAMKMLIEKGFLIRERGKRALTSNPDNLPLFFFEN